MNRAGNLLRLAARRVQAPALRSKAPLRGGHEGPDPNAVGLTPCFTALPLARPLPHPPLLVMRLLLRSAVRRLQGALHAVASLPQVTLLVLPHALVAVTAVGTCPAVCGQLRFLQALCSSILLCSRHVAETVSLVGMAHIRVVLPSPCNVLCPTHCLSSCSPDFSLHLHIRTASPSSLPYVVSQPKWEQAVRSVLRKDEHVVFAVIGFWVRLLCIFVPLNPLCYSKEGHHAIDACIFRNVHSAYV